MTGGWREGGGPPSHVPPPQPRLSARGRKLAYNRAFIAGSFASSLACPGRPPPPPSAPRWPSASARRGSAPRGRMGWSGAGTRRGPPAGARARFGQLAAAVAVVRGRAATSPHLRSPSLPPTVVVAASTGCPPPPGQRGRLQGMLPPLLPHWSVCQREYGDRAGFLEPFWRRSASLVMATNGRTRVFILAVHGRDGPRGQQRMLWGTPH